jgi:hypothetical protein
VEDAGGLVAVVAVGDQQLRPGQRLGHRRGGLRVGDPPQAVAGAVLVDHLARGCVEVRLHRSPGGVLRVVVEREDRREVGLRGAGEPEAVLLRAGVRALVRADPAGAVVLDLHAGEEAVAGPGAAVGAGVVLGERPQRGLPVADEDAVALPVGERPRRVLVGVAVGAREVDLHGVVGGAGDERGALLVVDDVVRRRRDGLEAADGVEVVVDRAEGLDVGHAAAQASTARAPTSG